MLTKLQAYSQWDSAQTLILNENGREETDLIQIRNIDGLDPVKATVNTSPFGSVDGGAYLGSVVPTRNIVLTVHPNPDWSQWTVAELRRVLYLYFMPKSLVRLVFHSDDMDPVEIYGYVEEASANPFTTDLEMLVSIICPDPYFTAVAATVVTGKSTDGSTPTVIDYPGDIQTGFNVQVIRDSDPAPTTISVQVGDPSSSFFKVTASVSSTLYFVMNSVPGSKYVQNVTLNTGVITNLLSKMVVGSTWPELEPGKNNFSVITTSPDKQEWQLTYFARYGGL